MYVCSKSGVHTQLDALPLAGGFTPRRTSSVCVVSASESANDAWRGMMGNVRVVYRPHPGITSEEARDARARAWKLIFDSFYGKATRHEAERLSDGETSGPNQPNRAKRGK